MENYDVTISEKAIGKIKEFKGQMKEAEGKEFRVYVQGGGCSGYSYGFMFDDKRDGDLTIQAGGVTCFVDPQSLMFLKGSIVNFVEGLTGAGFAVENPNAKSTCGCGSSFSV